MLPAPRRMPEADPPPTDQLAAVSRTWPRAAAWSPRWAGLATFARSLATGGAATLADLAVIALVVGGLGLSPRVANVPALLVGAVVQFVGNRHFAFRAASGSIRRQSILFAMTEAVALVLNGVLYDAVARAMPLGPAGAVLARALTTNLVFLAWSYPAWRKVFRQANARSLA